MFTLAGCAGVPRDLKLRETFYLTLGASDATGVGALVWDLDGFHPNNEGHRLIAELFLKLILPIFEIR